MNMTRYNIWMKHRTCVYTSDEWIFQIQVTQNASKIELNVTEINVLN